MPFTSPQERSGNLRHDRLNVPLQLSGSFMLLIYWRAEATWSSQNHDSTTLSFYYITENRSSEGILQYMSPQLRSDKLCLFAEQEGALIKFQTWPCLQGQDV